MRYSKTKRIITAIVSVFCIIIVALVIIKGIDFAKKANGTEEKTIKTSVTENKVSKKISNIKKKVTKKTTKETKVEEKKTKNKEIKTEEKKVVEEEKKVENPVDEGLIGKYVLSQLIIDGKDYTDKEIKKLKKDGNSLSLDMKEDGVAILSVLDTNGIYEYDYDYFYNGTDKIAYSKNTNRIRIKVDDKNMLFIKE